LVRGLAILEKDDECLSKVGGSGTSLDFLMAGLERKSQYTRPCTISFTSSAEPVSVPGDPCRVLDDLFSTMESTYFFMAFAFFETTYDLEAIWSVLFSCTIKEQHVIQIFIFTVAFHLILQIPAHHSLRMLDENFAGLKCGEIFGQSPRVVFCLES
jgi:hypothetical protein